MQERGIVIQHVVQVMSPSSSIRVSRLSQQGHSSSGRPRATMTCSRCLIPGKHGEHLGQAFVTVAVRLRVRCTSPRLAMAATALRMALSWAAVGWALA